MATVMDLLMGGGPVSTEEVATKLLELSSAQGYADVAGREMTQEEATKLAADIVGHGNEEAQYRKNPDQRAGETIARHMNWIKETNQKIRNAGDRAGVEVTPEEITQWRDAEWYGGQLDQFDDHINTYINTKLIDQIQNPETTLTEEEKTGNLDAARRQVDAIYGPGEADKNPDLVNFLNERLAEGESPYEIGEFLKTTTPYLEKQAAAEQERVKAEATAAREGLSNELLRTEQEAFKRALPGIMGSFMRSGRINSSGVDSAIAQAQKELESQRQGYLGGLAYEDAVRQQGYGREDFISNKVAGFNNYYRQNEPSYQRQLGIGQIALNRPFQLMDQTLARRQELDNYALQRNDYMAALDAERKRSKDAALYGLLGSAISGGVQGGMYELMR